MGFEGSLGGTLCPDGTIEPLRQLRPSAVIAGFFNCLPRVYSHCRMSRSWRFIKMLTTTGPRANDGATLSSMIAKPADDESPNQNLRISCIQSEGAATGINCLETGHRVRSSWGMIHLLAAPPQGSSVMTIDTGTIAALAYRVPSPVSRQQQGHYRPLRWIIRADGDAAVAAASICCACRRHECRRAIVAPCRRSRAALPRMSEAQGQDSSATTLARWQAQSRFTARSYLRIPRRNPMATACVLLEALSFVVIDTVCPSTVLALMPRHLPTS